MKRWGGQRAVARAASAESGGSESADQAHGKQGAERKVATATRGHRHAATATCRQQSEVWSRCVCIPLLLSLEPVDERGGEALKLEEVVAREHEELARSGRDGAVGAACVASDCGAKESFLSHPRALREGTQREAKERRMVCA